MSMHTRIESHVVAVVKASQSAEEAGERDEHDGSRLCGADDECLPAGHGEGELLEDAGSECGRYGAEQRGDQGQRHQHGGNAEHAEAGLLALASLQRGLHLGLNGRVTLVIGRFHGLLVLFAVLAHDDQCDHVKDQGHHKQRQTEGESHQRLRAGEILVAGELIDDGNGHC